jgi:hypothetical protein
MKKAVDSNDVSALEGESNEIVSLAAKANSDELRKTAFSIKLAARREDFISIIQMIPRLMEQHEAMIDYLKKRRASDENTRS